MCGKEPITRRQFVVGALSLALAGAVGQVAASTRVVDQNGLAIDGGQKTVTTSCASQPRWGDRERDQLSKMLEQNSLFYWNGPQTQLLLERFRKVCPVKYAFNCSSGTAALHIAVSAAGIGPGDEVITTSITDIGTVIGILYQQGVPVFADLQIGTHNLDAAAVERCITPRTKAIIAVHLTGNPCDLESLRAVADRHGLILIEDCAQAWGAKYRGKPVGTVGDIACFSLQNSKHITCGDGGIVASNSEQFGPHLRKFGDKGNNRDQWGFSAFATNYRMSEPQAAVAAAQFTRLDEVTAKRNHLGRLLTERIADAPGIIPHEVHADDFPVYWFYYFRIRPEVLKCNRSQFVHAVAAEGAPVRGGYIKVPLYGEPVFQNHGFFAGRWPVKEMGLTQMDFTKVKCPNAESMLSDGVRVPIYEYMTPQYIEQVAAAIQKVARHYAA